VPGLRNIQFGFFGFYEQPAPLPTVFITGVHLYALAFLGALTFVAIRWSSSRVEPRPTVL
jgi:hypothetical protein